MINFKVDHYAILGIPPDADLQAIKHAYRIRALESHPDRGGSHQAMLAVNEAYEILSNPEMRQTYDQVRAGKSDDQTLQKANADASWAREKADQYPRDGKEFESWLNSIVRDFTDAKFDTKEIPMFPTVENSRSGCLFLLVGAIAGGWIGYYIWGDATKNNDSVTGRAVISAAGAGAFVAMWIHKAIGRLLRTPPASPGTYANQARGSRSSSASSHPTVTDPQRAPGSHPGGVIAGVIAAIVGLFVLSHFCTRTVSYGYYGTQEEIDWTSVLLGTAVVALVGYAVGNSAKGAKPSRGAPGTTSVPSAPSQNAIDTHCPHCGKHLRIATTRHNVRARCPWCHEIFQPR